MRSGSYFASLFVAVCASLAFSPLSCAVQQPQATSYFDSTISPILTAGCVRANTGTACHVADAKGNAFGNLDLSTFEGVNRRRDLLQTYGPYPRASLLLKNIPPLTITTQTFDGKTVEVSTDIKHSGLTILDPIQTAASTLQAWIQNGATEFGTGPVPPALEHYPCNSADPVATQAPFNETTFFSFESSINRNSPGYMAFMADNGPSSIIQSTCGSGNCHGTPSNELFFLCGNDQLQQDWNYFTASEYISKPASDSEILRRPLNPAEGGSFHEGGVIFSGPTDPHYLAFKTWADVATPTYPTDPSPNLLFFAHRVQPMLVKKGCMMLQCHSAAMFHDFKLRGGSGGSFSYAATLKNYQLSLAQLGVDSPDFNSSRIARKNLFRPEVAALPIPTETPGQDSGTSGPAGQGLPQVLGITHRGGPLFEDFTGGNKRITGAVCAPTAKPPFTDCCPEVGTPTPNIYDTLGVGTSDIPIPAYCIFKEWHARERAQPAAGPSKFAPLTEIVYVKRPPQVAPDRAQDFDVFAGGAELHIAKVTPKTTTVLWTREINDKPVDVLSPINGLTVGADAPVSLSMCGLAAGADVRRPAVSWDGTKIAFAARGAAGDPLAIYEMNAAGTTCQKLPLNTVTLPSACPTPPSGVVIHNFDPAYAADGRIVFASTRGNLEFAQGNFSYCGPQVTPADPSKPNSNIYVYDPTSQSTTQLTYLLNMERHPSMQVDGRVVFTTEKREPNFYELALRRENLDTGDYHPLFSQRGSIGYYQADDVVEMDDKNFAAIFSTCLPSKTSGGAPTCPQHGAGVLGTFNRSIGVDYTSDNSADYPVDPNVIPVPGGADAVEPSFFLHSLRIPPLVEEQGTSGTPGQSGYVFTTPSPVPGGSVLVSRSAVKADPGTFNGQYDLCTVDPETGFTEVLVPGGGQQVVEAVAVYPRFVRGPFLPAVFQSALDEPNAHTTIVPGQTFTDATYLDLQVLTSLFFQNTPTGRVIDTGLTTFDVYEELPPDPGVTSLSGADSTYVAQDDFGSVWVKRRPLMTGIQVASDASAHVTLPGGVPIVFHLPNTTLSTQMKLPRWQREEVEYSPGETLNQSMPGDSINSTFGPSFFNSLCGQCHNAISGKPFDVAVNPDILTQASIVTARTQSPTNLNIPPASRSTAYVPASQIQ